MSRNHLAGAAQWNWSHQMAPLKKMEMPVVLKLGFFGKTTSKDGVTSNAIHAHTKDRQQLTRNRLRPKLMPMQHQQHSPTLLTNLRSNGQPLLHWIHHGRKNVIVLVL